MVELKIINDKVVRIEHPDPIPKPKPTEYVEIKVLESGKVVYVVHKKSERK